MGRRSPVDVFVREASLVSVQPRVLKTRSSPPLQRQYLRIYPPFASCLSMSLACFALGWGVAVLVGDFAHGVAPVGPTPFSQEGLEPINSAYVKLMGAWPIRCLKPFHGWPSSYSYDEYYTRVLRLTPPAQCSGAQDLRTSGCRWALE